MFRKKNQFSLVPFLTGLLILVGYPFSSFATWQISDELSEARFTDIGADDNGHAIVVTDANAFRYESGTWNPTEIYAPGFGAVAIDVSPPGTALTIYRNAHNIFSSYFDGSTWTGPTPVAILSDNATNPLLDVALSGTNQGVAIWIDLNSADVFTAHFDGSSWSSPLLLGTGGTRCSIAYNSGGTAVAGWSDSTNFNTSFSFDGITWLPPVILDTMTSNSNVGIGDDGQAVAVWLSSTNDYNASTSIDGVTWTPNQLIGSNADAPSFAMSKSGIAIATWTDTTLSTGLSSTFDGATWSSSIQINSDPFTPIAVSLDSNNEALVIGIDIDGAVASAQMPFGGTWSPIDFIGELSPLQTLVCALSIDPTGFITFVIGGEIGTIFAAATLPPVPPTPSPLSISGKVCENVFATQKDRVRIISWTPSTDPTTVAYHLRRNGALIAIIPSKGPFTYYDHGRCKKADTYTIAAADENGIEGPPAVIVLK